MLIFHGRRISLNLVLLLVVVNYVSWFRLVLMYISCIISIGLSHAHLPGFYLLSAIVHRNRFFRCTNNKSSESKVNFRQTSNRCKRVLEAAKLAYANKTKELITSEKLGFRDLLVFSAKVNLLYLLYSTARRCCLRHLIKAKLFAKNFSNNSNLDDSDFSWPVFPCRTNLKLHNVSVTPKMVKKVTMNLDLSQRHLALIVFQWWF